MNPEMTPRERRATVALAGIMSTRMLGLFMILPVFALYARELQGVTPVLVGLAIGIYGLTQALLQIPFGMISDRLGRKPVITVGLLIFALGSVIAALSPHIGGVILGRALQGAGAISAALMALTADLTREEHRTKAMAVIGMSIGLSFTLALVLGPLLDKWIGVGGIFWVIAGLALLGIALLHLAVPSPRQTRFHRDAEPVPAQFKRMLRDPDLLRLDLGVMALHAQLTAAFVVLPVALHHEANLDSAHHWYVYLPVLVVSLLAMVPFIILAEKRRLLKQVLIGAVLALSLAHVGLAWGHAQLFAVVFWLLIFFTAFNLLEASLPSLVSKIAPVDGKGTALGIYTTSQYLGIFLGGMAGGWLHQHHGMSSVFLACAGLMVAWLWLIGGMTPPRYLSSYLLNVGPLDNQQAEQLTEKLRGVPGVAEAVVIIEDEVAYLKIDRRQLDFNDLDQFSAGGSSHSAA